MFVSRRKQRSARFTIWKVALLFLGAGIWIAGMIIENRQVTLAAIIVVTIALLLGLVEGRGVPVSDEDEQLSDDREDV
jgi:hypothetical protein